MNITVRPNVRQLCLADPAGVRTCAGRRTKTDRNDSLLLAQLLRANLHHQLSLSLN